MIQRIIGLRSPKRNRTDLKFPMKEIPERCSMILSALRRLTFKNTRNDREPEITKTVTGNMGNRFKPFEFTIKLEDDGEPFTGTVKMWLNGLEGTAAFDENGEYTFNLKHGEFIKFELPLGIDYTVTVDGTETNAVSGKLEADTTHEYINDRTIVVPTKAATGVTCGMIVVVSLLLLLVLYRKKNWK